MAWLLIEIKCGLTWFFRPSRKWETKSQVPSHRTPFLTEPREQCMQEFQLLTLVESAVLQTAIELNVKINKQSNTINHGYNIRYHNMIYLQKGSYKWNRINLGVTEVTNFKPRGWISVQESVFQFQISMTNFLQHEA